MITRISFLVAATLGLSVMARAQNGDVAPPVQIRAVMFDPTHAMVDLFIPDPSGTAVKLNLQNANLSPPQLTQPVNGKILFYTTGAVNPEKPMANLAATLKVPQNVKRAIVILVPGPPDSQPAFRAVLIDDTTKGFPKGESRVLSLVPVETAIQAGEHKRQVLPGKVTAVPSVKQRNEFNIAQTNFYYKQDGTWVVFTERQLQFLDAFRRIFIISVPPGGNQPFVTTIVDTAAPTLPGKS